MEKEKMKKHNSEMKQKIYWIGEHSFAIFKSADQTILSNFDNQILLFSRTENPEYQNESIVYLDEFYPMMDREYSLTDLQKPVSIFLKEQNISFENGLIIGDASEILVQTIIAVGSFEEKEIKDRELEFAFANKIKSKDEFNMVDVSGFSFFFLKEALPFKDAIEMATIFKNRSTKTFQNVLTEYNSEFKINEFLYHLENGIEAAVNSSKGVEYYTKMN